MEEFEILQEQRFLVQWDDFLEIARMLPLHPFKKIVRVRPRDGPLAVVRHEKDLIEAAYLRVRFQD